MQTLSIRRPPRAAALLLLLLALPAAARADGVVRDSMGAISSGRGGTNLAYSDNLSLINDNPAGLARMGGLRFELGLDFLKTDLSYMDPQNHVDAKDQLFALPMGAASFRFEGTPRPITVGLGVFLPAGFGAEYQMTHPVYGRERYLSEASLLKVMPTFAVELGPRLSIGAGVGMAYQSTEFDLPYTFQTGALAGTPALVDAHANGFGVAWNVGVQYRITDRWTVGAAYIAETQIELEGDFDLDGTGVLPFPDSTASYDLDVEMTWPRSVGVGSAYRFDRGSVSLDFLWFDWSSAFDALTFHLKNGDNPTFDAVAGPRPSDKFPLEWRDSYTMRLGGEFQLTPVDVLRGGYIWILNPVPEDTLNPLIPAILEHAVSIGYGRRFDTAAGKVGLDVAYQFSWGRKRNVHDSEIVGGDFDESSMRAMAHWFFVGGSLSF